MTLLSMYVSAAGLFLTALLQCESLTNTSVVLKLSFNYFFKCLDKIYAYGCCQCTSFCCSPISVIFLHCMLRVMIIFVTLGGSTSHSRDNGKMPFDFTVLEQFFYMKLLWILADEVQHRYVFYDVFLQQTMQNWVSFIINGYILESSA